MPKNNAGMLAKGLGKPYIDLAGLFPVDRRGIAVVVPLSHMIPVQAGINPQHLRILLSHPSGARAGGRCQNRVNTVFIKLADDPPQPTEVIDAFLGLQLGPGENRHGNAVDVGFLH